jgi:hypothetical protein
MKAPDEVRVQIHQQYTCILDFGANQQPFLLKINASLRLAHVPRPHQKLAYSFPSHTCNLCASPTALPFAFLGLLPWLDLLFSTPDISASDFPQVRSKIAQRFHVESSQAGFVRPKFGSVVFMNQLSFCVLSRVI